MMFMKIRMGWRMGDWHDFKEGQIHQITKRCVRLLHDNGFSMEVNFAMGKKKIHFGRPEGGFFEILKEYEQDKGIAVFLEMKKKIHFGRPEGGLFEILKEYEQDKGIAVFLEILICDCCFSGDFDLRGGDIEGKKE